jgi:hypothetical protein
MWSSIAALVLGLLASSTITTRLLRPLDNLSFRTGSLGELLQAHRSAQAAIDSFPDPVAVFGVEGSRPDELRNDLVATVAHRATHAADLAAHGDPPVRRGGGGRARRRTARPAGRGA